jgi:predicted nucleotide-binding protein (sugar kinase/HSP70/actin superfamily)
MEYALRTFNLCKKFKDKVVINNLNMNIMKGKIYGFLGENGSGKTTTIKLITNLLKPSSGSIEFFGEPIENNSFEMLKRTGSIIESPCFYEKLTAVENLEVHRILMGYEDKKCIDEGLKYVNNDACYPSIITVGQIIEALKSGEYDLKNTSVMISQTGGGCRATNYIGFLRKALKDAGFSDIPVISLNFAGLEKQPGFKTGPGLLNKSMIALVYGDLLMRVLLKVRPYEKIKGSAKGLYENWMSKCKASVRNGSHRIFKKYVREIVRDFDSLEINNIKKPKVGLVGEILVKFHPTANNNIVDIIENEGAEAVMPDLTDFILYCALDADFKYKYLSGSKISQLASNAAIRAVEFYRHDMKKALDSSSRFEAPKTIRELADGAKNIVSLGNQTGEGWFLTAEMVELIESGAENIVCMQPFACLPNHVTGKGMLKELKRRYNNANIVAVDYDPGASEVNQLNRIKLMLSTAFEKLNSGGHLLSQPESNYKDEIVNSEDIAVTVDNSK